MRKIKYNDYEFKNRVAIVTDVLRNHRGKMFTAYVIKQNGEYRQINGRLGSSVGVKGTGDASNLTAKGMVPILEIMPKRNEQGKIIGNDEQWRTINFNSLMAIKMRGKILVPVDIF